MTVLRSTIRRRLIATGRYDDDREALEKHTDAVFRWRQQPNLQRLRKDHGFAGCEGRGAQAFLERVSFPNGQMAKRNLTRIEGPLSRDECVYLYGSGAGLVTLAMAWLAIFVHEQSIQYFDLSDLYKLVEIRIESQPFRGWTLIDTSFDPNDGKIWASQAHTIRSLSSYIRGGVLLFNSRREKYPNGAMGKVVTDLWTPVDRLEVMKK